MSDIMALHFRRDKESEPIVTNPFSNAEIGKVLPRTTPESYSPGHIIQEVHKDGIYFFRVDPSGNRRIVTFSSHFVPKKT